MGLMRPMIPKLHNNAAPEKKSEAIETLVNQYINSKGSFDAKAFSKDFKEIKSGIEATVPDWKELLIEYPIFSDDELSESFSKLLSETDPSQPALAAFTKEFQFEYNGLIKEFSSVKMNSGVPPVGQELIVWNPGLLSSIYAICTYADEEICTFRNLGIGGDFSLSTANVKWLPAKRFEDVKSPSVVSADIRSFSRGSRVRTFTKR